MSLGLIGIAMAAALSGGYEPADSVFHGVHILTLGGGRKSAPGASADWVQRIGPFKEPAVVFVSADARTDYGGPPTTTGIRLRILAGDKVLSDSEMPPNTVKDRTEMSVGWDDKFFLPAGASVVLHMTVSATGDGQAGARQTTLISRMLAISAAGK